MDDREKNEEKNKRIGWLTSVGVQLVLLVLFYFIVAWKEPFPPIPEYGIELGFTTSAGAPAASAPSQSVQEVSETPVEQETPNETTVSEVATETAEIEESVIEETPVSEVESPVEVEDTNPSEPVRTEEVVEEKEVAEEEPKVEEIDSRAVMGASSTESDEVNENPSEGEEKEKEVDQRAIYGSQGANTGNSEGAQLNLTGWIWDKAPIINDNSTDKGKIVFEITIDDKGEIRRVIPKTYTVTLEVLKRYEKAVRELTFSPTSLNKSAQLSTGIVTFTIKSK
ncbi:hypothetical protein [Ekhidna sp.]